MVILPPRTTEKLGATENTLVSGTTITLDTWKSKQCGMYDNEARIVTLIKGIASQLGQMLEH